MVKWTPSSFLCFSMTFYLQPWIPLLFSALVQKISSSPTNEHSSVSQSKPLSTALLLVTCFTSLVDRFVGDEFNCWVVFKNKNMS